MIICTCFVCGKKWGYPDDIDENLIRASCSPCGHQGCFDVKTTKDKNEPSSGRGRYQTT